MTVKHLEILLADDDTDDCAFFEEALAELPISTRLTAVHDGEKLMQLLNEETGKLPHILFLDLNMPRKNGFECLAEIKGNKKLNQLPVIILSTSYEQEVINLLFQNGAQYFIRKPSAFAQFKKIIQYALTLITEQDVTPPAKDHFVLTVENSQPV
ncbi:MAG: response regulator [Chitinophagaceae bacterium]|nr:response regulator [Chitinophagaceae bacterium]